MFLVTLIFIVIAIIAISKANTALKRVSELEEKVSYLVAEIDILVGDTPAAAPQAEKEPVPEQAPQVSPEPRQPSEQDVWGPTANAAQHPNPSYSPQPIEEPETLEQLEQWQAPSTRVHIAEPSEQKLPSAFDIKLEALLDNFKQNWLVWIGALAMLIGGGYLVQVIGSQIDFSPATRISIALTLSIITLIGGERFHRKEQSNSHRKSRVESFSYVPAAITATGLTGVYCSILFAFLLYQMLSPATSLFIMASIALCSLALSLRQGPLMAVLGLIGGYSAPLWVSTSEPNYLLLSGYICLISIAGTMLMQASRRNWLTPSISVPHLVWAFILYFLMPNEHLVSWLVLFIGISIYLIYAVPRLGWRLQLRYRHRQTFWSSPPPIIAGFICLLVIGVTPSLPSVGNIEVMLLLQLLLALIWLPALDKGYSTRIFLPIVPMASLAILVLGGVIDLWFYKTHDVLILIGLGASITLVALRTIGQYLGGDRSRFATLLLLTLAPSMAVMTLAYCHFFDSKWTMSWTLFCTIVAGLYFWLGLKINRLSDKLFACVHAIIASICFIWLDGVALTTAISLQVALMALQLHHHLFKPADWAVKLAMSLLAMRLTLLPFIPEWQPQSEGNWAWVLASYLPALLILGYSRQLFRQQQSPLANWFESAFLHIFAVTLFTQTNYLLTGSYGFSMAFDSLVVLSNQALIMALVYQFRRQHATHLQTVYQFYTYLLLVVFAGMAIFLNTIQSPLRWDHVAAQALPLFNMLSVGWIAPAAVIFEAYRRQWLPKEIPNKLFLALAALLSTLWVGMSIRQFWQPESMTLYSDTGMAEMFSYSAVGLAIGAFLTWEGTIRRLQLLQRSGLVVVALVALKVFLWDAASLEGFWRAISFLGLGASLITISWLFQRLGKKNKDN
ncbi:DUF2339 domain-containing protein [Vibrio sp. SCSIO 43136]|uniref:DUF2339 domain-containing protein n=1 Tax=Vibrio sp. SCSIO 43136 TaxID=2819101 RepID=UPI0020754109|nr:DUF2339 domain-containing protein [Vibrio sp. SCSIO 43136]USD67603.1 DUF2339 domain-containing protein [Vibrio sp. SCSIO 43136]